MACHSSSSCKISVGQNCAARLVWSWIHFHKMAWSLLWLALHFASTACSLGTPGFSSSHTTNRCCCHLHRWPRALTQQVFNVHGFNIHNIIVLVCSWLEKFEISRKLLPGEFTLKSHSSCTSTATKPYQLSLAGKNNWAWPIFMYLLLNIRWRNWNLSFKHFALKMSSLFLSDFSAEYTSCQ